MPISHTREFHSLLCITLIAKFIILLCFNCTIADSTRPFTLLAKVRTFQVNDGQEVQPSRKIGRNLVLEIVAMPSLRRFSFYLAVRRPEEFPVRIVGNRSQARKSRHRSQCHYSAWPIESGTAQLGNETQPGLVSLCSDLLRGTLSINVTHLCYIQATGHRMRLRDSSWQVYQLNLYPSSVGWKQRQALESAYDVLNKRIAALSPQQLTKMLGGSVLLQRHRRSARFETRSIKLELSRKVLSREGPFILQLYLIVDNGFYKMHSSKSSSVIDAVQSIIGIVNNLFRRFDIYVVVGALEIHSSTISGFDFASPKIRDPRDTLHLLKRYVTRIPKNVEFDCVHLLNGRNPYGSTAGDATKKSMCDWLDCCGLSVSQHSSSFATTGLTMTQKLAYNLGVKHDHEYPGRDCNCPYSACMMSATILPGSEWRNIGWSSCSVDALLGFLDSGVRHCMLLPRPETENPGGLRLPVATDWPKAVCGNGFLEDGEACDCGGEAGCRGVVGDEGNACCDATTCQLAKSAACAAGRCCDLTVCKPRPTGTVCRAAKGQCDLPEFCNGVDSTCPADFAARDGTPCDGNFCANGLCGSAQTQCQLLWGPTARDARSWCTLTDMECDRIECANTQSVYSNSFLNFGSCIYSSSTSGPILCEMTLCNYNPAVRGPDRVPDGARCGNRTGEQMCLAGACQSASEIRARTAVAGNVTCHNGGIVNSRGNCHCPAGFAPPDCQFAGNGGSIDSGPPGSIGLSPGRVAAVVLAVLASLLCVAGCVYWVGCSDCKCGVSMWRKAIKCCCPRRSSSSPSSSSSSSPSSPSSPSAP